MARTLGNLIDEATSELHGWGSTQDRVTTLAADIGPGDLSLTVTNTFGQSTGTTPGILEIDGEQIYTSSADALTGTCAVTGFGRGYNGTTAIAHTAGAKVTSRPKFPRIQIQGQMSNVLGGLFPDLFAVGRVAGLAISYPSNAYEVGDDMRWILAVSWQSPWSGNWERVRRWRVDEDDNMLRVGDTRLPQGVPLRVLYAKEPGRFLAETDDFETVTGLPLSAADLLVKGTVRDMMPGPDISRTQNTSVEQSTRSTVIPPNAGLTVSKYIDGLFQTRLANESRALRRRFPATIRQGF